MDGTERDVKGGCRCGLELGFAGHGGTPAQGRARAVRVRLGAHGGLQGPPHSGASSSLQLGRSGPDAKAQAHRGIGTGWGGAPRRPRPAASPLPTAQPSDLEPPARQTRPRAEDPKGIEGREKEVASPRQGILNYRLKASKTVHHIFHVSADGHDKRKHRR